MSDVFWCCQATTPTASPEARLAEVRAAAERNLGYVPATVRVHPKTAYETPPHEGLTLVADARVPSRWEYRFVLDDPKAEGRL